MKLFKRIGWWLLLIALFGASFAANPSYNFVPASGTQLKLQCNYTFNVSALVDSWSYNWFAYAIKFNSWDANLSHILIDPWFAESPWYSVVNNIYRAWGSAWSANSNINRNLTTFWFKSLVNINQTILEFTTYTWWQLSFGAATTDDWTTLDWYATGGDILVSAPAATYTFVPLPCVPDATNPTVTSTTPTGGARYIPNNQVISFTTYDWIGSGGVSWPSPLATNNTSHYWYSGLSLLLTNYVAAPVTVDNQEGVNSWTIRATVACSTCSSPWSYVLSGSSLTVTDWAGDGSRNQLTWNSKRRGYNVSFAAPASYEVEKLVTVTLQATDNPNETLQIHTWSSSFSFNAPLNPTIERKLPSTDTFVSPSKVNVIRLFISDDWAGVNTGSVKITIPTIMSWAEQLLTGYTYSWSELNFVLSWGSAGLGNSGKYIVEFYSNWDFPSNETISITWIALDLAGNTGTLSTSFTTRPDCSFFGCNEVLNVNILGGTYAWSFDFTWTILIVTGTNINSPYPYLTGTNNDILMCGYEWTWAVLTGNVQIYDSTNTLINGTVYSGNALYITGLNFTIVDWVIVVQ